jgi:hypothetical protein
MVASIFSLRENKAMKKAVLSLVFFLASCGGNAPISPTPATPKEENEMKLTINDQEIQVTWEENPSVSRLKELAKDGLTIQGEGNGGFEQVAALPESIPSNDVHQEAVSGDIMLYVGRYLCFFYGENAWAYTKIGHMEEEANALSKLLSQGPITVTLSA